MGFFNKLKSALGYSENDYDEDDELDGLNPSHRTPYVNPFKKEDPLPDLESLSSAPEPADVAVAEVKPHQVAEVEEKLPEGVFDGIITIINSNLPEFVRDCIDIEKERKAVNIAMGPQFRNYVVNLRRNSLEEARRQWVDERNQLNQRLSQSNQRADEAVRKAQEIKDRLMSEERQRRAIVERSHDLESRIADLEAQHEQNQLQNKGLLNKLKVMQLQVSDSEKDAEEISRLTGVVNEQRQKLAAVAELEEKLSAANVEIDVLQKSVDEWKQKSDNSEIEQEYKSKMEVTNALINELQSAAAAKEQEVKSLSEKLRLASGEVANLQSELKTAQEELEIAAEIQEKIEQFEVIKDKKDAEIRELRKRLADAADQSSLDNANAIIAERDAEVEQLKAAKAALEEQIADANEARRAHDVELANQIDALNKKLGSREKQIAGYDAEMATAQKSIDELAASANKFKADNMVLDVQVKNLKANINDRDAEIKHLRRLLDEKGVDAANVEIERPEATVEVNEEPAVVSAIDEIDNIDWLMPSPPSEPEPEPEPAPSVERQKPSHDIGAAQMSLFGD